jgi:hypothetical protein
MAAIGAPTDPHGPSELRGKRLSVLPHFWKTPLAREAGGMPSHILGPIPAGELSESRPRVQTGPGITKGLQGVLGESLGGLSASRYPTSGYGESLSVTLLRRVAGIFRPRHGPDDVAQV